MDISWLQIYSYTWIFFLLKPNSVQSSYSPLFVLFKDKLRLPSVSQILSTDKTDLICHPNGAESYLTTNCKRWSSIKLLILKYKKKSCQVHLVLQEWCNGCRLKDYESFNLYIDDFSITIRKKQPIVIFKKTLLNNVKYMWF